MYNEWSLNALYKGIEDPQLAADMARLAEITEAYKQAVYELNAADAAGSIRKVVDISEEMTVLTRRLGGYFSLRRSANSSDAEGSSYMTKIQALTAGTAKESVMFQKFVGGLENLNEIISGDEILSQYGFYFEEMKKAASHKFGDEAEAVFAQMNISGGKTWQDLVSYMSASVEVDYKGGKTTLSAIRGLADSEDPAERKAAYEAELACYSKIKDSIAFALNSIKAQVNLEAKLRGFENPLEMTLDQSRMQKATLDAMLQAMREAMPKFREYLKHKAKLLGYENGLPWFEVLAPVGNADSTVYTARARLPGQRRRLYCGTGASVSGRTFCYICSGSG